MSDDKKSAGELMRDGFFINWFVYVCILGTFVLGLLMSGCASSGPIVIDHVDTAISYTDANNQAQIPQGTTYSVKVRWKRDD